MICLCVEVANLPFEGLPSMATVDACKKTCATCIDAMSRLGPKKMPCWSWFPLVNQVCACADMTKMLLSPTMIFGFHAEKKMCIASPTARGESIQIFQTQCLHSDAPDDAKLRAFQQSFGHIAHVQFGIFGRLLVLPCWLLWCVACSFDVHVCAVLRGGAIIQIILD